MEIPIRYLLIELLCGVISVLLLMRYGVSFEWAYWTTFSLVLVLIAMIDYTHLLIPNRVIVAGALLLTTLKAAMGSSVLSDATFAFCLMTVAYVFVRGVSFLLKKRAMGMGDVKLMGLIAFAIGWQEALIAIWVSAIIGSVIGGALILTQRQSTEPKLPFGTMLASVCLMLIPIENNLKTWIEDWLI
jgi:prepilin signal peptidase PulO-like enzyme (type II secretory pathway)